VDDAAFWLSLVAIALAFGSLLFTWRADQRAARAESASRRARIVVESSGSSGSIGEGRTYTFKVRNLGAVHARGVQLWLTKRGGTQKVSSHMASGNLVLVPFEEAEKGSVVLVEDVRLDQLDTWVAWTDDDGPHEELRKDARPT
jgi:hypothetical protein